MIEVLKDYHEIISKGLYTIGFFALIIIFVMVKEKNAKGGWWLTAISGLCFILSGLNLGGITDKQILCYIDGIQYRTEEFLSSLKTSAIFLMMALVFIVIRIAVGLVLAKRNTKVKEKTDMIAFYNECVKNNIHTCTSEKEAQRAGLIAKKYRLEYMNIIDLFYEAKSLAYSENKQKEAELKKRKIQDLKMRESNEKKALEMYCTYSGREKRIAMLRDEMNQMLAEAESLKKSLYYLEKSSQQKEHDWAVLGGIANGIAGAGAGVATAIDAQMKNQQIRAQNQANLKTLAPVAMNAYTKISDYVSKAEQLGVEIEETKLKLVSKDDANTCMNHLEFYNTSVDVTETGSCIVTTTASLKEPVYIFDDVKAVIDGTIMADIYDGSDLIGTALMVLPTYGVGNKVELRGISLFCGVKDKSYNVKFSATNLWAIEK